MDQLIKINSLTVETKHLKIQDNLIEFDNQQLDLNTVSELRYGSERIRFDMFTIGRKFTIELKHPKGLFLISFKYYLGISRNHFFDLFNKILIEIWENTGVRLVNEAIAKLKQGENIKVGQCVIKTEGIGFKNSFVNWDNLSYQKNYDRITLNNKANPKVWTNVYYLETFNFDLLIGILDWLYKHNGLNEIKDDTSVNSNNFQT